VKNINIWLPWHRYHIMQDSYHCFTRLLNVTELFIFTIYSLYLHFVQATQ
jgi:hypothetical protein